MDITKTRPITIKVRLNRPLQCSYKCRFLILGPYQAWHSCRLFLQPLELERSHFVRCEDCVNEFGVNNANHQDCAGDD